MITNPPEIRDLEDWRFASWLAVRTPSHATRRLSVPIGTSRAALRDVLCDESSGYIDFAIVRESDHHHVAARVRFGYCPFVDTMRLEPQLLGGAALHVVTRRPLVIRWQSGEESSIDEGDSIRPISRENGYADVKIGISLLDGFWVDVGFHKWW